jgi:putative transposase
MMPPQGRLSVERMCARAEVSRASCYRHWRRAAPRRAQTELRNRLQRLGLAHRHYGFAGITDLRLLEEFAFLAVVIDGFSRRVVGWALEVHPRAALAVTALEMALAARRPPPGQLIHHSDRGVQYACAEYTAVLAAHGIRASMSRTGSPYDNATAESFMSTLKREEVDGRAYRTAQDARGAMGRFIKDVYNRQRLHSALNYLAPAEFEATLVPASGQPWPERAVHDAY